MLDEPTTGLDVVTQALVLAEVRRLCREMGVAIVYVSHDLAVVAEIAHRIAVMYAGRIVEQGPASAILVRPRHPYTLGLIESIPDHQEPRTLHGIPGGAVGVAPRRPLSYFVRVRVRSLFAGSPFVGENSIVRLSLIEPDFLSAAFPAAVGLSVSLILPALLMESLPP